MLNKQVLGLFAAALLLSSSVKAGEAGPQTMHHHHHFFAGNWECTGQIADPHSGKKQNTVGKLSIAGKKHSHTVVDNWQNYTSSGFAFKSVGWTKYDELSQTLNRYAVNNMGGWTRAVSTGFDGKKMVWTGKLHSPLLRHQLYLNEVATKKDDNSFKTTVTVAESVEGLKDGLVMYEGTCSRVQYGIPGDNTTPDHGKSGDSTSPDSGTEDDDAADESKDDSAGSGELED